MKCCVCKTNIAAGAAAQKMIVEYAQPDGSTRTFGYMMSDGPLSAATGRMARGFHHKCFYVARKRQQRADAATGNAAHEIPTGYEIGSLILTREELQALGLTDEQARARGTAFITVRLGKLRTLARRIGKAVGDATVLEAFWGEEHGGPYPHQHQVPLDTYQLHAHLLYAHGTDRARSRAQDVHDLLHAQAANREIDAARNADPGYAELPETDWRQHVVGEVEKLT